MAVMTKSKKLTSVGFKDLRKVLCQAMAKFGRVSCYKRKAKAAIVFVECVLANKDQMFREESAVFWIILSAKLREFTNNPFFSPGAEAEYRRKFGDVLPEHDPRAYRRVFREIHCRRRV